MDHKQKIAALTEELLMHLKKYNAYKEKLQFEMETRTRMAQLAVNIMFDTKITPGPLCSEALDAHDRSVTNWLKKNEVKKFKSAV